MNEIIPTEPTRTEIWKPISGYERLYEVSNAGRVRSCNRRIIYKDGRSRNYESKIMTLHKNKDGYLTAFLYAGAKRKTLFVHRLIAKEFIGNHDMKPEVNHKDGNKANNDVGNLEWATHSANMNHAYKTGLHDFEPCRVAGTTASEKSVICLNNGRTYKSQMEASRVFGVDNSCISDICRGKSIETKGYRFAFV